jgi:hypothetical protein
MNSRKQKISSAVALFLVFSISQVYVQANLLGSKAASKNAATPALAGKLVVSNPIKLNGNATGTSATVLSGATLETPAAVPASVILASLGKLDIAPLTTLTLNFNNDSIEVALSSGAVTLTTNKGINGTVTTAKATVHTDSSKLSSVSAQSDDNDKNKKQGGAAPPSGAGGAEEGGMSTATGATIGAVAVIGAVFAAVYIPCRDRNNRGNNPSPSSPNNNEDCRRGF